MSVSHTATAGDGDGDNGVLLELYTHRPPADNRLD